MQPRKGSNSSEKLTSEIRLARLRVAKAESQLTVAKGQARMAKRRRKEARQAARRAKKQAKLAKREFAHAKLLLAEAEQKLNLRRKPAPRAKPLARRPTKARPSPFRKNLVKPRVARKPPKPPRTIVKRRKVSRAKPSPLKTVPEIKPQAEVTKAAITVPRDFEKPAPSASQDLSKSVNEVFPDKDQPS